MAKTLAEAQAKYERSVAQGGAQRYAQGLANAPQAWAEGMSQFLGAPVSGSRASAYQAGLAGAPEKYARGVAGKGAKYAANLRSKMTG